MYQLLGAIALISLLGACAEQNHPGFSVRTEIPAESTVVFGG